MSYISSTSEVSILSIEKPSSSGSKRRRTDEPARPRHFLVKFHECTNPDEQITTKLITRISQHNENPINQKGLCKVHALQVNIVNKTFTINFEKHVTTTTCQQFVVDFGFVECASPSAHDGKSPEGVLLYDLHLPFVKGPVGLVTLCLTRESQAANQKVLQKQIAEERKKCTELKRKTLEEQVKDVEAKAKEEMQAKARECELKDNELSEEKKKREELEKQLEENKEKLRQLLEKVPGDGSQSGVESSDLGKNILQWRSKGKQVLIGAHFEALESDGRGKCFFSSIVLLQGREKKDYQKLIDGVFEFIEIELRTLIGMLNESIKVFQLGKGEVNLPVPEDVCSRSVAKLLKNQQIGDKERAEKYIEIMKGSKEYVDYIIVEVRIYIDIYIYIYIYIYIFE